MLNVKADMTSTHVPATWLVHKNIFINVPSYRYIGLGNVYTNSFNLLTVFQSQSTFVHHSLLSLFRIKFELKGWQILITYKLILSLSFSFNYMITVISWLYDNVHLLIWGAVMAQWLRSWTLNYEVPDSNPLGAAVVPLGKALLKSL